MNNLHITWIAEQNFRGVYPSGQTFDLTFRLSLPVTLRDEPDQPEYAQCRIAIAPLAQDRWVKANNGFQALCMAIEHLRTVFKVFLAEGGRIYWEDTDSPIDINSCWFAPLPSLRELQEAL